MANWLAASSSWPSFGRMPTDVDPLPHLRLATKRGELGDDQGVGRNPQCQDEGRGDGQAAAIPAEPADAAAGDRLAGEAERSVIGHCLEVGRKLRGRGVAIIRVRGQAAADDRLESRGHVRVGCAQPGSACAARFRRAEQGFGHRHRFRRQRERPRSPHQAVEEDDAQGIEIGARVDVVRHALGERLQLLGRHVGEGPAQPRRGRPRERSIEGSCARLKSSSIGRPSPLTRTFDGLTSRCKTWRSWACSSASANRAPHQAIAWAYVRRASAVRLAARSARAPSVGWRRSSRLRRSAPVRAAPICRMIEDLKKRDPAEIRHAEQMKPGGRIGPVRVDGDDVGVLEPRERLRLARTGSRHLERDGPVGQMPLLRKIDPRECASAQLLDQPEPRDRLAGLRERRTVLAGPTRGQCAGPAEQVVNLEDFSERVGDVRKPGPVLRRLGRLAGLLAEAILLVEQSHQ